MRVVALVQARMGSTRLPDKVMKPIGGVPMIELLLARLARSREIDQIVVATSVDTRNRPLVEHVRTLGYACEQGSENDVLDRYVQAAKGHQADVVVRITGDCPLVDPGLVDEAIRRFKAANVDYLATPIRPLTRTVWISKSVPSRRCSKPAGKPATHLIESMSRPIFANMGISKRRRCSTTRTYRPCAGQSMRSLTSR